MSVTTHLVRSISERFSKVYENMPLSYELKQLLKANAAKEPEQVTARNSQALRLNLDGRQVTLVNRMGMSTEAGRYFYRTVRKQPLPDSRWDDDAPTYRKSGGRTDYVKTRANQEVALRTWNPAKKGIRLHRCRP